MHRAPCRLQRFKWYAAARSPETQTDNVKTQASDSETIVNVFVVDPADESADDGHSVDTGSDDRPEVLDQETPLEPPVDTKEPEILAAPHPALFLEDVLLAIFECADIPTRARGAVVSRRFMRPALAALWRKSAKMFDIFSLIAPLEREPSILSYCFTRPIMPSDWTRFTEIYAPLIQEIHYCPSWSLSKQLSLSTFDDIARSRLQLHILPNLLSLRWHPLGTQDLRDIEIFMSPSVKSLDVAIPTVDEVYVEAFFAMAQVRTPNVRVFQFECAFRVSVIERWLCNLLESFRSLRELGLSHYYLTTNVVASASRLPELQEVLLWSRPPVGDVEDVMGLNMRQLETGAFPKLKAFSLDASLAQMQIFASKQFFNPTVLTYLHITSLEIERPSDLHDFLETLAEACPPLETLVLSMLVKWVELTTPPRITLDHIRPLFNFKSLLDFDVTYNYPFAITDADLECIARSWPKLRTLMLSEYPYFRSDDIDLPTLGSLLPFAEHCPDLINLGLFLNVSLPFPTPSAIKQPFRKLEVLNFGQSYIQDADVIRVAAFISRLCDPSVQIKMGHAVSVYSFSPCLAVNAEDTPDTEIATRNDRWEKVVNAVGVLQQARQLELDRIRELERRLAELTAEAESLRQA
ncbi:hypothetical protein RhiJN_00452 [Ceratobasidium sp. AG-Ba]|nr:hypothetical protein RhiJN_00452 [Ceratobasidium sp. AG-Ba]